MRTPLRRRRPRSLPAAAATACVALACGWTAATAQTPPAGPSFLMDSCETSADDWIAESPDGAAVRSVGHQPADGAAAAGCAEAVWTVSAAEAVLRFVRPVPPSAAIEDVTASVAVLTRDRAAACLRVAFPNAVDRATGLPAAVWVVGDPSEPPGGTRNRGWATLTVAASDKALADARRRVRASLGEAGPTADLSAPLIDRAGVILWASTGQAWVRADDLRVGPLVPVAGVGPEPQRAEIEPRAVVRGGRMAVDGRPFFPRLTLLHGADPAVLASAGFNLVQVLDWRDERTLDALAAAGLGAAAAPPLPGEAGAGVADLNVSAEAGLAPFTGATDNVLVWNLGPRLDGDAATRDWVRSWVAAVRAADVDRRRPALFGVTGGEQEYSRIADLLGVSRMVCGTALPLWEHTDLLREAVDRKVRPGEPVFTWLQTSTHRRTAEARAAAGLSPAVIEPELIERQALGAVAAGVKGIGFWLTEPLDDATPARRETRLALTLTNLQLAAVEPILAGATRCEPIPFRPRTEGDPDAANRVRARSGSGGGFLSGGFGGGFGGSGGRGRNNDPADAFGGGRIEAAAGNPATVRPRGRCAGSLLHRGSDRLVVAVWQGEHDQYVPGPAPFTGAEVTIPGAIPTASAWLVTPVGVTALDHRQVAGGMQVSLDAFDGTALLLVTPDQRSAAGLRRRIAASAPAAAGVAVQLAALKLERTKITGAALPTANPRLIDALLRTAGGHLAAAERALRNRDWDLAWRSAERCKRFTRAVQRAHWDRLAEPALAGPAAAPRRLDVSPAAVQPTGSPHLIAFSTLPDHLALSRRLAAGRGASVRSADLLEPPAPRPGGPPTRTASRRTGEAGNDDGDGFRGWVYSSAPPSVAAAAVRGEGDELRLTAQLKTGFPPPDLLPRGVVAVRTPPVAAPPDRAAVVRGEVQIDGAVSGEGVTVHDSWGGELLGLRWTGREPEFARGGWVPFELVRPFPPPESEFPDTLTATLQLHGLGTARFRRLGVDFVDLDPAPAKVAETPDPPAAPAPRLLDRLPVWRRR